MSNMQSTKFSIAKFVPEFLQMHPEERFTAREIALWIMSTYPAETEEKRLSSKAVKIPLVNDAAMIQQIIAEIGAQRPQLEKSYAVRTTESRPRKYYFSSLTIEAEAAALSKSSVITHDTIENDGQIAKQFLEHDLYPLLADYLRTELSVLSLRIDEKKSINNKGPKGNQWLYPDLVGMEDLTENWDKEVVDCVKMYSDRKTKLWSFEVKLILNQSNVRESYFQAVSNSSWANFSYLVTSEISGGGTNAELRLLSSLHGVGVIELNTENPLESQIIIPSRERIDVDWGSVNRIVEQNSDFRKFIKLVRTFYQTGEIHDALWYQAN